MDEDLEFSKDSVQLAETLLARHPPTIVQRLFAQVLDSGSGSQRPAFSYVASDTASTTSSLGSRQSVWSASTRSSHTPSSIYSYSPSIASATSSASRWSTTSSQSYPSRLRPTMPLPDMSNAGFAIFYPGQDENLVRRSPNLMPELPESLLDKEGYSSQPSTNLFCTYCAESNVLKSFKVKSDWKKHETRMHESGYDWICPILGCNRVWDRQKDFLKHHQRDHSARPLPSLVDVVISLLPREVFGCGFDQCKEVSIGWDERCDHVAMHMKNGASFEQWRYSTVIHNLLRQEALREQWYDLIDQLDDSVSCATITWSPDNTRILRQKLEHCDLRPSRVEVLITALLLRSDLALDPSLQQLLPSFITSSRDSVPNISQLSREQRMMVLIGDDAVCVPESRLSAIKTALREARERQAKFTIPSPTEPMDFSPSNPSPNPNESLKPLVAMDPHTTLDLLDEVDIPTVLPRSSSHEQDSPLIVKEERRTEDVADITHTAPQHQLDRFYNVLIDSPPTSGDSGAELPMQDISNLKRQLDLRDSENDAHEEGADIKRTRFADDGNANNASTSSTDYYGPDMELDEPPRAQPDEYAHGSMTLDGQLEYRPNTSDKHRKDFAFTISKAIRDRLNALEEFKQICHRGQSPTIWLQLTLDWNPVEFFKKLGLTDISGVIHVLPCLTGSYEECQATTVKDYIMETWPESGDFILTLLQNFLCRPDETEHSYSPDSPGNTFVQMTNDAGSSCLIRIDGDLDFAMEVVDQVAWLASALRSSPVTQGVLACSPRVEEVIAEPVRGQSSTISVSCHMAFEFQTVSQTKAEQNGSCWVALFRNPILVKDYPIRQRTSQNTGLEMSLRTMAALLQCEQVVQWGQKIIMKSFNSLLIATLATATAVVWHMIVNEDSDERISYNDPRLDTLKIDLPNAFSLRGLEGKRHIVGWCSNATDLCGHATANQRISSSGLPKPPASIVIDRLYIEGGSQVVGGLNMSVNKKEKPFWLERGSDYPSLLKWVSLQPMIFYDVCDRRAWLVDGVSALLHLVRISLYLDENDAESPYDWVFDPSQLKDSWDGCTGRLAALKTLKSWENLNLNVYIKDRSINGDVTYATLGERIKRILHSIEILVDRQAKITVQDGFKVSQTVDFRNGLVGFDLLDVIVPLGPIDARIKRLDSRGHGWIDLVPSLGAITIFGKGFGELIRSEDPGLLCGTWRSVPTNNDLMTSSTSTLKMLYEKRLQRMEPGLGVGEMTSKIMWSSSNQACKWCRCPKGTLTTIGQHVDPTQYLVSKKLWKMKFMSKGSTPVDVATLDENGAVVFAHLSYLGQKKETDKEDLDESTEMVLSDGGSSSSQGVSAIDSADTQSTGATSPTPSSLMLSGGSQTQDSQKGKRKGKGFSSWRWKG